MKSWYQRKVGMLKALPWDSIKSDPQVEEFMAKLQLLYLVPYSYLLPDEEMLKEEQLCFFYIDEEWVRCLIQGGMHVGAVSEIEKECSRRIKDVVYENSRRQSGNLRSRRLGKIKTDGNPDAEIRTGFLLRSEAVRCWPGIEVLCFGKAEQSLPILRLERIANDVLLCIAAGKIETVELAQPTEAIHFDAPETYVRTDGVLELEKFAKEMLEEKKRTPEGAAELMVHRKSRYRFTAKWNEENKE